MTFLQDYLHIMSEPAHALAEATYVTIEILLARPVVRWMIRRHDQIHHTEVPNG